MKKLGNSQIKILLVIAIVVTLISGLSTTYAFFIYRNTGSNVSLETGEISITFANDKNYIDVDTSYPISDEMGKVSPYYSDFTIDAITNNVDIRYEIQIVPNSDNTIDSQYIKVYLTDQNDNPLTTVKTYDSLEEADYNNDAKMVYSGYMTKSMSKNFRLRVWIDENYISDVAQDFGFTIYLYSVNDDVTLLVDEIETTVALTDPDADGTRFVYGANVDNNYVWYSGKLWRIVGLNNDGSIKLVTQNNMTSISWNITTSTNYSTSQVRSWLNNEFLPTLYNSDIMLTNHEWDYTTYESFPTVKLTPQNTINEKIGLLNIYEYMMTGGTNVSNTSATFLGNLSRWFMLSPQSSKTIWSGQENKLVLNSSPNEIYGIRPVVNLVAGINLSGGNGTKTNPYTVEGDLITGQENDLLNNRISGEYINFNNVLYRVVGIEEINDQKLTKITAVNNDTLSTTIAFGNSYSDTTFNNDTGIGKYLNDWYNADEASETYASTYITNTYRNMIATAEDDGIVWYQGPDNGIGGTNYLLAETGSAISATIGLGRYGEIFMTQIRDNNVIGVIWTITKENSTYVMMVENISWIKSSNYSINTQEEHAVRPYFYLKSDVMIGDVDGDGNVGTGMPHDPYEIVQ